MDRGSFHRGGKPADVLITHTRSIVTQGIPGSVVWIRPDKLATAVGDCARRGVSEFVPGRCGARTMPGPEAHASCNRVEADHVTAKIKRLQGASHPVQVGSYLIPARSYLDVYELKQHF